MVLVFIKVMCRHERFTQDKRQILAFVLSGMIGTMKELAVRQEDVAVTFSEDEVVYAGLLGWLVRWAKKKEKRVVYGSENHALIEVLILQECESFPRAKLASEIGVVAETFLYNSTTLMMNVGCVVDMGDGNKSFWASTWCQEQSIHS